MSKIRLVAAFFGMAMISSAVLQAQSEVAPAAPLPSQILTAKKVFISNANEFFNSNYWSGTIDRPYNEFYAAIKDWGRYELVSTPGDADMVLQISLRIDDSPRLELVVLDPKTRIILRRFSEDALGAGLKNSRDKKFSESIDKLVGDLKALTAQSAANPK